MAWRSSGATNEALIENLARNGLITQPRVKQAMLSVPFPLSSSPPFIKANDTIRSTAPTTPPRNPTPTTRNPSATVPPSPPHTCTPSPAKPCSRISTQGPAF